MPSPWKDFLDFSTREQATLLFMVALIVAGLLVLQFHRELFPLPPIALSVEDQELIAQIEHRQDSLNAQRGSYANRANGGTRKSELPEPFPFDPNQLDSTGFVALGFSPKQAGSILKYRAKGGKYRKPSDFEKSYVVSDFMYTRLAPYIQIADHRTYDTQSSKYSVRSNKASKYVKHSLQDEPIEINSASIEDLQTIPGIGPSRSKGIVKYRELKGGFTTLDQLDEVYSLRDEPEVLLVLKQHLTLVEREASTDSVTHPATTDKLLDINSATKQQLIELRGVGPIYAKRILAYRDKLRGYSSIDQLNEVYGIAQRPEDFSLISPQLFVGPNRTPRIDINTADWQVLVGHPYIDSKVAKSIIAMREVHGRYREVAEIKRSKLISDELYERIKSNLTVQSR